MTTQRESRPRENAGVGAAVGAATGAALDQPVIGPFSEFTPMETAP